MLAAQVYAIVVYRVLAPHMLVREEVENGAPGVRAVVTSSLRAHGLKDVVDLDLLLRDKTRQDKKGPDGIRQGRIGQDKAGPDKTRNIQGVAGEGR